MCIEYEIEAKRRVKSRKIDPKVYNYCNRTVGESWELMETCIRQEEATKSRLRDVPSQSLQYKPKHRSPQQRNHSYAKESSYEQSQIIVPSFVVYFKNGKELICDEAWEEGNTIFLVVHSKKVAIGYDKNEIDMEKSFDTSSR